jgi:hypothetical protein
MDKIEFEKNIGYAYDATDFEGGRYYLAIAESFASMSIADSLERIAVALEEANEIARARVKLQMDGRIGS